MKTIQITLVAAAALFMMAMAPLVMNSADHEHNTITSIAADNENFSTLVAALEAAGLDETLKGDGPFTVFAPTNEAFEALPEGTLESLLEYENRDMLVDILTYHVVPGKVMSTDLSDGMRAETVQGSEVTITVSDYNAAVDGASISDADIEASNGVIHVIDAVILPQTEESGY